jgi:hypothetical protein
VPVRGGVTPASQVARRLSDQDIMRRYRMTVRLNGVLQSICVGVTNSGGSVDVAKCAMTYWREANIVSILAVGEMEGSAS